MDFNSLQWRSPAGTKVTFNAKHFLVFLLKRMVDAKHFLIFHLSMLCLLVFEMQTNWIHKWCETAAWKNGKAAECCFTQRFPSFSISRVFYYWWWPPSSSTFTRYILIFNYFGRYLILLCSPFSFLLLSLSALYWLKLPFSSAANESTRTRVIFYTVGEYLGCC